MLPRRLLWHPTQKSEPEPDGSLLLRFTINHLLEVKRLALSFGPDCEVLEPASLREEIAQDLVAMTKRMSKTSTIDDRGNNDAK